MGGASPTEEQQTAQTGADLPGGERRDPSASNHDSGLSESPSVDIATVQTASRRAPPRERRAPPHPNPSLVVPQELRERAVRIVQAGGASETIAAEEPLPETPPNALLVLCLEAVESVGEAEWGGQGAGFKSQVLAWLVGSALSPAPPPDAASADAKRLMQHAKEVRRDLAATGD